jgi:hypothetical protein
MVPVSEVIFGLSSSSLLFQKAMSIYSIKNMMGTLFRALRYSNASSKNDMLHNNNLECEF